MGIINRKQVLITFRQVTKYKYRCKSRDDSKYSICSWRLYKIEKKIIILEILRYLRDKSLIFTVLLRVKRWKWAFTVLNIIFHFISFLRCYYYFFHLIPNKLIEFPIVFLFIIIIIQEERARQKEEREIKEKEVS